MLIFDFFYDKMFSNVKGLRYIMAFDGIVTKSIVSELDKTLTGGKINKVFEPNKNEILLDIYSSR